MDLSAESQGRGDTAIRMGAVGILWKYLDAGDNKGDGPYSSD